MAEWVFTVSQDTASIAAAQKPVNAANHPAAAAIAAGEAALDRVRNSPDVLARMAAGEPESQVNGVWIWILQQYLQFDRFIVAPEFQFTGQGRGDALVIRTSDAKKVFGYEGKKALTNLQQWNNSNQLTQYLRAISNVYGYGFGVCSSGTEFSIRRHTNGSTTTDMVRSELRDTTSGNYYRIKTVTGASMLKLTSGADVTEAKNIFRAIITKQWTT